MCVSSSRSNATERSSALKRRTHRLLKDGGRCVRYRVRMVRQARGAPKRATSFGQSEKNRGDRIMAKKKAKKAAKKTGKKKAKKKAAKK